MLTVAPAARRAQTLLDHALAGDVTKTGSAAGLQRWVYPRGAHGKEGLGPIPSTAWSSSALMDAAEAPFPIASTSKFAKRFCDFECMQ